MKNMKKAISTLILSSVALQITACGNLDLALPQIKQLGENISTVANALEAQSLETQAEVTLSAEENLELDATEVAEVMAEDQSELTTELKQSPEILKQAVRARVASRPLPSESADEEGLLKVVHTDTSPLGGEKVYAMSFRVGEKLEMGQRRSIKLAQFNHPGLKNVPMIAVRYVEVKGQAGIVVLHRENARGAAKVVGKARLKKGSINHLAFHLKWSNRENGFLRVFYKAPEMKTAKGITGIVTGKTAYAQAPRVMQLENLPLIQSRLRKVFTGRDLLKFALRKLAEIKADEASVDESAEVSEESVEENA